MTASRRTFNLIAMCRLRRYCADRVHYIRHSHSETQCQSGNDVWTVWTAAWTCRVTAVGFGDGWSGDAEFLDGKHIHQLELRQTRYISILSVHPSLSPRLDHVELGWTYTIVIKCFAMVFDVWCTFCVFQMKITCEKIRKLFCCAAADVYLQIKSNHIESIVTFCADIRLPLLHFALDLLNRRMHAGKDLCETDERAEWSKQRKKNDKRRTNRSKTINKYFDGKSFFRLQPIWLESESDTYTVAAAKSPKHSEIQFATSIFQLTSSHIQGIKRLYCRLPFDRWGQIIKCERRAQFRLVFLAVPILWPKGVRAYWICIDQYSVVCSICCVHHIPVRRSSHKIWWHSNGSVWLENGDDGRMPEPTQTTKIG